jgi:UPF0755 protein
VVDSSFFFRLRASLSGRKDDLRAGTFALRRDMSYGAALDVLTAAPPPPPMVAITIPEGRSIREEATRLGTVGIDDYVAATRSSPYLNPRRYGAPPGTGTLEGFLFPDTYTLRRPARTRALVREQVQTFARRFAGVDLRAARRHRLTAYDVLIIASMVEREAEVARERRLIAAVIYNRLRRGMPLQIDATLRYAANDWTHPIRQSQLRSDSPYNTYRRRGLPPTPIGSPGMGAIQAAAHPARVAYLYYVVKPGTCGRHAFSSTSQQFQRDLARYNRARARKGGRSPTTCPG